MQAYVGTEWWTAQGLTPQDFCLATWMTSVLPPCCSAAHELHPLS